MLPSENLHQSWKKFIQKSVLGKCEMEGGKWFDNGDNPTDSEVFYVIVRLSRKKWRLWRGGRLMREVSGSFGRALRKVLPKIAGKSGVKWKFESKTRSQEHSKPEPSLTVDSFLLKSKKKIWFRTINSRVCSKRFPPCNPRI